MRPDLFAGSALRDDSHRILARLANGGSVPVPARQWIRWDAPRRARLAAIATLLATSAAAWVWLQKEASVPEHPPGLTTHAAQPVTPQPPAVSQEPPAQQAATIVNAALERSVPTPAPPAPAPRAAAKSTAGHPRYGRTPNAQRRQQAAAMAPENDEDVTLLAAMLKHAKPQKPSATPPKD